MKNIDADFTEHSPQVFVCPCQRCCHDAGSDSVPLPRQSSLGTYVKAKNSLEFGPAPGAWPFTFVCFDCGKRSRHPWSPPSVPCKMGRDSLDGRYFGNKSLWHIQIEDDGMPEILYTIAPSSFDRAEFVAKVSPPADEFVIQCGDLRVPRVQRPVKCDPYSYDFWPPGETTSIKIL